MFAIAGLIELSFLQPAVLFTRSHDVITLLALTGAGLINRPLSPRNQNGAHHLRVGAHVSARRQLPSGPGPTVC